MSTQRETTESLMDFMDVAFVKIDCRNYHFLTYNDAMFKMIGYTRQEYEDTFHGDMHLYFTGEYADELKKLEDAAAQALNGGVNPFRINLRIPSKNGEIHIAGAGSVAEYEAEGKLIPCLNVLYRDVSDVYHVQEELEQMRDNIHQREFLANENKRMQSLLDSVPGGLSTVRIENGKVVSMRLNKWFQNHVDIKGVIDDSLDIRQFTECLHPDDREQCRQDFYSFLNKGESMAKQYRFRNKQTGVYYWGSVRGSLQHVDGHTEVAYFTYTDINEMKRTEQALRESRSLYEHSVDSLHLGLWKYDIKNRRVVLGKNESTMELRRLFGWPEVFENAPESTYSTVIESDRADYIKMFNEVTAGHDASCDVWYADPTGLEPHCERESYHVVFDEEGKPSFAYGVGQNITADRKVKERYIRELEFLKTNVEAGLIAKGHYNLSKNKVLEYENLDKNRASQPIVGYTYDAFIALVQSQAYEEKDRIVIGEKLNRRYLIRRYQEGQMQSTILYQKKFNDDPFWISLTIHTYMRPETNDLELFSYAYDITESKMLETIMSKVSDNTFDYIGIIDAPKNTFELIRKSRDISLAEIRVKAPYDELRAKVEEKYISNAELQRYREATSLNQILSSMKETGKYTTTFLMQKSGRVFCKQIDCLWMNEQYQQILVVRTDVTDAYERDQQYLQSLQNAKLDAERANDEKSAFLSSMSHDMRTPLNGIISYTRFALKADDPLQKQEYLNKVADSGNLLLDLVDDTLELSRIESGKVTAEPESFELKDMIDTIVTSIQPAAAAKQIHLDIDLDGQTKALLWGDRRKIQKILLNLLTNSVKYTHVHGEVKLKTSLADANDPSKGFVFMVEDNGIGMSKEFMTRMYEPFAQEKRSESVETPGTGLGLSIVKKYTDLMSGKIEVESVIHEGTKWKIYLPIVKAEVREEQAQTEEIPAVSLKGKHILLCEDNQMNTEIALVLLKDKGIITDTAPNGKDGVRMFSGSEEGYYDAILMDIQMPVMNGNEAAKQIRSLDRSDAKSIPIIAMSADVFEESIRASKEAGMNGYITKPLDPDHMFRELYQLMK